MIADEMSIPQHQEFETVTEHLATRKVCVKFMPRMLSEEQKVNRKTVCQDVLYDLNEDSDFSDNVVTGDETWVFEYDPENNHPQRFRNIRTNSGCNFLPESPHCKDCKNALIVSTQPSPTLGNAPSHTAFRVGEYLTQHNVATLPHLPYSPARLLSVPENKIDAQEEISQLGRGGSTGRDEWAKQHSGPSGPGGVRKLENSLAAVCRCGRVQLSSILHIHNVSLKPTARFSQFKELSETIKFIMYPDETSFDSLNLTEFDRLKIEMQLINFKPSSI
ncbi:uncharacterized protein TNCV_1220971 [Trichonephila clavipes]|nr:uncharacterized protein TNCV_1220971 [Trichonephila clavipes]